MNPEERSALLRKILISIFFKPTWTRYRNELQAEHPEGDYYRKVPYTTLNPIFVLTIFFIGVLIGLIF